jgi:hypothetical protein
MAAEQMFMRVLWLVAGPTQTTTAGRSVDFLQQALKLSVSLLLVHALYVLGA